MEMYFGNYWKTLREKKEDSLPDPQELQNHFSQLYKQKGDVTKNYYQIMSMQISRINDANKY